MPISVRCPSCSKVLTVPDQYAGKRGKCPGCQQPVMIPAAGAAAVKAAPALSAATDGGRGSSGGTESDGSREDSDSHIAADVQEAVQPLAHLPFPGRAVRHDDRNGGGCWPADLQGRQQKRIQGHDTPGARGALEGGSGATRKTVGGGQGGVSENRSDPADGTYPLVHLRWLRPGRPGKPHHLVQRLPPLRPALQGVGLDPGRRGEDDAAQGGAVVVCAHLPDLLGFRRLSRSGGGPEQVRQAAANQGARRCRWDLSRPRWS